MKIKIGDSKINVKSEINPLNFSTFNNLKYQYNNTVNILFGVNISVFGLLCFSFLFFFFIIFDIVLFTKVLGNLTLNDLNPLNYQVPTSYK